MGKKRKNVPITVTCDRNTIELSPSAGYVIFKRNYDDRNICSTYSKNAKYLKHIMKYIRSHPSVPIYSSNPCIRKVSKKRLRRIKRHVRKYYANKIPPNSYTVFIYGNKDKSCFSFSAPYPVMKG